MKLTNKHNAHPLIVSAIKNSDTHRTYGDISVTQLIDSPQIRILRKNNDVEVDVMSRIAMLFGTAGHQVLEYGVFKDSKVKRFIKGIEAMSEMIATSKDEGFKEAMQEAFNSNVAVFKQYLSQHFNKDILLEHPMTIEIDGMVISGTLDYFQIPEGALNDFKFIGTFSYIYNEHITRYEPQQNTYTLMLEQIPKKNYQVNFLQIIAVFKDWTKSKVKMTNYPEFPTMTLKLTKWGSAKTIAYLQERVRLHRLAEDEGIMECTPEEMWATADTYKVMEKGIGKSKKNNFSRKDAQAWIDNEQANRVMKLKEPGIFTIKVFPGERRRCESYCDVSSVCPQYAKWKKDRLANENGK